MNPGTEGAVGLAALEGNEDSGEPLNTVMAVSNAASVALERSRLLSAVAGLLLDNYGVSEGEPARMIKNAAGRYVPATTAVVLELYGELARWSEQEEVAHAALMQRAVVSGTRAAARLARAAAISVACLIRCARCSKPALPPTNDAALRTPTPAEGGTGDRRMPRRRRSQTLGSCRAPNTR